jgi:acyl-CoA thioesterase
MTTFDDLTRAGTGIWDVPDGWQQGRGAFGGLTFAALARAASATVSGRALRTITGEIPSPVLVGPARVSVATLRAGSGLTTVAAHLEQGGDVVAHAVLSFGKVRVDDFDRAGSGAPPPTLPPFGEVPVVPASALEPTFTRHLEYRAVRGIPFTGASEAVVEGWVRLREPGDVPRPIALVALVDAWFPSVLPLLTAPRPFGTIAFAAHLFEREWSLAEPLYHRSVLVGSQQGYIVETRELFTPRGELCIVNQQTLAIIK